MDAQEELLVIKGRWSQRRSPTPLDTLLNRLPFRSGVYSPGGVFRKTSLQIVFRGERFFCAKWPIWRKCKQRQVDYLFGVAWRFRVVRSGPGRL
jgi:hypothetical protein